MYTRCPECHTTHVLAATDLVQAGGVVSCGDCRKVFNALIHLFEAPPKPGEAPAVATGISGMPPVLRPLLELSEPLMEPDQEPVTATTAADDADPQTDADSEAEPASQEHSTSAGDRFQRLNLSRIKLTRGAWLNLSWGVLALSLLGLLGYQIWTWTTYQAQMQTARELAEIAREPEAFRIISRDVHPHPAVNNAQILSLRMRNTADHPQPYPVLEVKLLDTTQNVVAVRRYQAEQYLPGDRDRQRLLESGEDFPLWLQVKVPTGGHGGVTFRVL
ncbi:MAG: hypothetical protein Tsb002_07470 [Wenzhouxiangellaceae bacterium]